MRLTLEHVDRVASPERHEGLFPVGTVPRALADLARLAALVRRPHTGHLHPEQRLDRLPDRRLRRPRRNLEGVLTALLIGGRALLGHDRTDDGAMQCWHVLLPLLLGRLLRRRFLRRWLLGRGLF